MNPSSETNYFLFGLFAILVIGIAAIVRFILFKRIPDDKKKG